MAIVILNFYGILVKHDDRFFLNIEVVGIEFSIHFCINSIMWLLDYLSWWNVWIEISGDQISGSHLDWNVNTLTSKCHPLGVRTVPSTGSHSVRRRSSEGSNNDMRAGCWRRCGPCKKVSNSCRMSVNSVIAKFRECLRRWRARVQIQAIPVLTRDTYCTLLTITIYYLVYLCYTNKVYSEPT